MPNSIIPARVPLVDPETGMISREWYLFLVSVYNVTGGGGSSETLDDVQKGPIAGELDLHSYQQTVDAILSAPLHADTTKADNLVSGILVAPPPPESAELEKRIADLESRVCSLSSLVISLGAELSKEIDGLKSSPGATI